MQTIMAILFTNWNFARWIRLGLGIFAGTQSVIAHDAFSGVIAALLIFQALSNTGCCNTIPANVSKNKVEEVEFEEVKNK